MTANANRDLSLPWSTRGHNLAHFLTRNARRLPDLPALIQDQTIITWAQLDKTVTALAQAMVTKFNMEPGDRVLVQSSNCFEMTEVMLACWRAGLVWVPSNYRQSPDEVAYLSVKSQARLMVCHEDFPEHATACCAANPSLNDVICIGDGFGTPITTLYDQAENTLSVIAPNADVDRDDPAWLFFTSGSTGRPKAVVLTHGQLTFTTLNHLNDLMPATTPSKDMSLVVAPLSHGAGMHQLAQIAAGVGSVLMPAGRFDPADAWRLIETHRVSNMFTVPTIVKMLTEHPSVDTYDHSSLRYVIYAGAPMYRADQKYALRALGPVLVQYFGLGEVTGAITVLPREDHHLDDAHARVGTCGYERTGLHVTIQSDTGVTVAPFETGEICVAGPAVCAGYYNDPDANEKAFRNGWFLTGDLGHMDDQGYVYITGRASDMYISGGSNVYPREIEEHLLTHPCVSEVAILGIPHPKWGEVGLAVIVAPDGISAPSAAELAAHIGDQLASYKHPHRYIFLSEMPKSGYGKITKKLVRETLQQQGLWPTDPQ